jgi:hypothetical protein
VSQASARQRRFFIAADLWRQAVNGSIAVVKHYQESSRPDIAWIKKNVPVLEVGKALGLRIRHRRAKCWRPENHTHGDADPSLHFFERGNRVRCFVCDMRGGHSNIDLVMGVLSVPFSEAVRWIAERFTVPNVKPGRPVGSHAAQATPYRVGVHASEFEILVRSGMFGQLPAPERSILVALAHLRDSDSGLTRLSYAGIMRYAGVSSAATVARALKQLARLRAIETHRGLRVGITRECSAYRVTLDDPKFLAACNEIFRASREEIAAEREYRKKIRSARRAIALVPKDHPPVIESSSQGSLRSGASSSQRGLSACVTPTPTAEAEAKPNSCEGLNLSSVNEVLSSMTLQSVKREIR